MGLRIYARGVLMKSWGRDDTCMVVTLILFTIYLSIMIFGALFEMRVNRRGITDDDMKTWYIGELIYVLAICVLKFAIGFFLLRVSIQRWHIATIKALMVGTFIFSIACSFLVVFQCLPISDFWNIHPASSKCLPKDPTLGVTYALSACNTATDWAFGLLPISIVWGLKMKMKTKLIVAGILAFAAIGNTATIVRMKYLHTLVNGPDFLHATVDIGIWSTVEVGIGLVAGNIATLRPLIPQCSWCMGLASDPRGRQIRAYRPSSSDARRRNHCRYRRSLSPSDLVPTEVNGTSTKLSSPGCTINQDMIIAPNIIATEVNDEIGILDGKIKQTVTWAQDFDSP
ncbi:hypothetical protein J1614_011078 [Plenodomus biglobosus]|nr:hypothetical protein J1614_011078 [Plenodomus biglobosus]